jgi:prepilin-type N-terminal cleavage/methylation domain-containing protein
MKQTKNLRKAGFTLVEIMIVVAIIGLLAAIAIPNFVKARATSQANACINNLRQIDAAANQFALENKKKTGDPISFPGDLTPYIGQSAPRHALIVFGTVVCFETLRRDCAAQCFFMPERRQEKKVGTRRKLTYRQRPRSWCQP